MEPNTPIETKEPAKGMKLWASILVIVIVLALGMLVVGMAEKNTMQNTPNDNTSYTADVESTFSTSDELNDIEADLETINIDDIGSEY